MTSPHAPETTGKNNRPLLVSLSHLRWDFVFQRPQHLLTRAANHFDVVFIEEPLFADGEARFDISERPNGIRVAQPILPHGTAEPAATLHQQALVDHVVAQAEGRDLIFWYYTPMALSFSRHIAPDLIVFDKMDELSAFKNAPPLLVKLEEELLARADVVFTGGVSMHEAAQHRHDNIHCFPSSIDMAHFAVARDKSVADPVDQASLPHPRLGFFGVIDERMDVDLVAAVADLRPDWQFVMIGPVVKIDPATLPQRPNIHWLGGRQYADLPAYLAHWDVGFMPFAINEATRFISPTKTPEFLAAGLPVVSTPIRDVVRPYGEKGLVEIAATAEEVVKAAETCLSRDRASWLAAVDQQLASGSWDKTWETMLGLMKTKLKEDLSLLPQPQRAKLSIAVPTQEVARV